MKIYEPNNNIEVYDFKKQKNFDLIILGSKKIILYVNKANNHAKIVIYDSLNDVFMFNGDPSSIGYSAIAARRSLIFKK